MKTNFFTLRFFVFAGFAAKKPCKTEKISTIRKSLLHKDMVIEMKRLHLAMLVLMLAVGVSAFVGCSNGSVDNDAYTVRVLLPQKDDYVFLGSQLIENGEPVGELTDAHMLDVLPGQSVRFAVEVPEGMVIECDGDNVSWKNGFITVTDIRTPITIEATATKGTTYCFSYHANNRADDVTATVENGCFVLKGKEITVYADVRNGQTFNGFSTGNYLSLGGKLVSTEAEYTFNIKDNTVLFANYSGFAEQTVNYYPNGGTITIEENDGKLTDVFTDSFYYCPNTRPDKGFFERDGYVLIGYNTKADGTGDYYGLGWNVIMPEKGSVDLYCQWAKAALASDFVYKKNGPTCSVTGYNGDDEFLVIPEVIEGCLVKSIEKNTFINASFREVYIPKTVTKVESCAFVSCKNLEKVNLSDSVLAIYDDSFVECDSFKTLAPQAVHYPSVVSPTNFTHHINFERLITRQNNIMLIVSGSTNIYGFSAKKLEEGLENKWDVITYATVASTPNTFYAEIGLNYLDEDDVLLFTPEASPDGHQWGTNYWKDIVWQINEGSYDAISLVDISNYTKVFSSYSAYSQARSKIREKTYEYRLADFNEYGEHITLRTTGKLDGEWVKWNTDLFFTDENVDNFNRVLDEANERGIPTMIGWIACNTLHTLTEQAKNRDNQIKYMTLAEELYHADFFGDLADYIYESQYVYDSGMHLTTAGSFLRTPQMINDIKAALIEHGLYDE